MKRLLAFVLSVALAMSVVSALAADELALRGYTKKDGFVYLNLGQYPQTADGQVLPIIWRVLRLEDDRAYMVSEYVLFAHRVHHDDKEYIAFGGDFRQTDLWALLNGAFAEDAFTADELALLVDTEDLGRLFLLSRDDLKDKSMGIGDEKTRRAWGTEYALNNVAPYPDASKALFQYMYKSGKHSPYWTRSQSGTSNYAANCTKSDGKIGWIRVVVSDEGVRPACYLDLNAITITGGAGTLDDPYTIAGKEVNDP